MQLSEDLLKHSFDTTILILRTPAGEILMLPESPTKQLNLKYIIACVIMMEMQQYYHTLKLLTDKIFLTVYP